MIVVHTVDGHHYQTEKARIRGNGVTVYDVPIQVGDDTRTATVFIPIRNVAAVITLQ